MQKDDHAQYQSQEYSLGDFEEAWNIGVCSLRSFLITTLAPQSTLLSHLFHREIPLEREIILRHRGKKPRTRDIQRRI